MIEIEVLPSGPYGFCIMATPDLTVSLFHASSYIKCRVD
jgi:hypothetical protein